MHTLQAGGAILLIGKDRFMRQSVIRIRDIRAQTEIITGQK
jgi:hypothetical protein